MTMTIHDMERIQLIKEKYPTGTRILNKRLIAPFQNLDNMKGTVKSVDDMGGIHMVCRVFTRRLINNGIYKYLDHTVVLLEPS